MKRKIALPIFLLAAVLCAVWSFIEAKQPTPASLREQLIDALKASKAYPGINQHKADIWIQHSLDVRYLCAAWRDRELERHLL